MKKQIKSRLLLPLKIAFWILNISLLILLESCKKEISTEPGTEQNGHSTFQKTYGGAADDYVGNVQQTSDSGYVIIGTTESYGAGYGDVYVIRTNAHGNIQWTKTYGAAGSFAGSNYGEEEGYSIRQTSDGGYIIGGLAYVCDGYTENFVLIKTDAAGNVQWNKSYGDFGSGYNYDVLPTNDGGYMLAGTAYRNGILCIKTNKNGETLWCKEYDYSGGEGALIVNTTDGGYAIAGSSYSGYYGIGDMMLIKTNSNGNVLWSKTYGYGRPLSLKQTTDGGFIIAGGPVIKTDASGNLSWSKTYEGTGAKDIEQTTDKGFIISCITGNYAGLIKTDANGEVIWSRKYGGGQEYVSSVHQVKDGGYVIAGQTSAFGTGKIDLYLVKTDSNGISGCNEAALTITVQLRHSR